MPKLNNLNTTFGATFWVGKNSLKMPRMVHFDEFLKTWSLRSYSVTRQVTLNRTKIGEKCQNWKFQMRHFWVIFKQYDIYFFVLYLTTFTFFCADIQKWREKLKHEELICLHLFLPPFPFTTKLSKSSLSSFFSSENCWCIREKNSAMFVKSRRSRGLFRIFAL